MCSNQVGTFALPQHEETLTAQKWKWIRLYKHPYSSKEILPVQLEQEYLVSFQVGTLWTLPREAVEKNVIN